MLPNSPIEFGKINFLHQKHTVCYWHFHEFLNIEVLTFCMNNVLYPKCSYSYSYLMYLFWVWNEPVSKYFDSDYSLEQVRNSVLGAILHFEKVLMLTVRFEVRSSFVQYWLNIQFWNTNLDFGWFEVRNSNFREIFEARKFSGSVQA